MNRASAVTCDATGARHSKQNFAPAGSSLRHFVQVSATRGSAFQAELRLWWILVLAPGTLHAEPPVVRPGVSQGDSSPRTATASTTDPGQILAATRSSGRVWMTCSCGAVLVRVGPFS